MTFRSETEEKRAGTIDDPFRVRQYDPHIALKYEKGRLIAGTPPVVHADKTAALEEASRLAKQHPSAEYCVFAHVFSCVTESAPVRVLSYFNKGTS